MWGDGLDEYYHHRGENIARTEAGNALNGARSAAMDRFEDQVPGLVMKKEWLSVLGETTRDSHARLDGVPEGPDGMWELAGIRIPWPAHFELPAGERCNCQCTLTWGWGLGDDEAEHLIEEYNERLAEEKAWRKSQQFVRDELGRFAGSGESGSTSDTIAERLQGQGLSKEQAGWAANMVSKLETIFSGPGRAASVNEVVTAAKYPEYLKGILMELPGVEEIEAVVSWSVRRGRMWETA
jgi:hypothetical protein